MTSIRAVIAIRVLTSKTGIETEAEIEIETGMEIETATMTVVAGGEVEVEIEIGMEVVGTGLGYGFAGLLALRARLTRRCTRTSTSAAGRRSSKMTIGGGRRIEAGVGSASLGRGGTSGARKVHSTKEGMRDDVKHLTPPLIRMLLLHAFRLRCISGIVIPRQMKTYTAARKASETQTLINISQLSSPPIQRPQWGVRN